MIFLKIEPPQIHMILQDVCIEFHCVNTYCFTNYFVLCAVDAEEIQGQFKWPGSLTESGSQKQSSTAGNRASQGLLETGKDSVKVHQRTAKIKRDELTNKKLLV